MTKSRLLFLSVVMVLLVGCGGPQPSRDSTATEIAAEIYATQTVSAAIPTPTSTSLPIPGPATPATQPPTSSGYYPMAVGDYWVSRRIDGDGTVLGETRKEVIGTNEMEGVTVFVLRSWDLGRHYSDSYYRVAGDHVAYFGADNSEDSPVTYHSRRPIPRPLRVLDIPFEVGQDQRYEYAERLTDPEHSEGRNCIETQYVVQALESVDVAAGHFEACYRVRTNEAHAIGCSYEPQVMTELYWFCPGVGVTKIEVIASPYESVVGMVIELVEYEVH